MLNNNKSTLFFSTLKQLCSFESYGMFLLVCLQQGLVAIYVMWFTIHEFELFW